MIVNGKVVVYTTGTFDLLHVGHVRLLKKAKELGDYLVVGVKSDEFIEHTKGKKSIFPCWERAEMVGALGCVDEVMITYGRTDYKPMESCKPYIRAVGPEYGQWEGHQIALEWMANRGIQIHTIERTPDISTTTIIERIQNG